MCFIPENYMKNLELKEESPACFSIGEQGVFSTLSIAYRKGAYLPVYAKDFINIAREYM